MSTHVIDSSVAVKWAVEETYSDEALALLTDGLAAGDRFIAPALLRSEMTNTVHQLVRRAKLAAADAPDLLALLLEFPVRLVARERLHHEALEIAREHGLLATYDAEYLALASMLDAEFWTADERLYRSARASGRVRWIAEYRSTAGS